MLPMLNMAKQDNMKWVFSSGKNLLPSFQLQHCVSCIKFTLAVNL